MKIKKLLALSLAGILTLGTIGCGNSADSAKDSVPASAAASEEAQPAESKAEEGKTEAGKEEEQITLRMAWWGSQQRHDATQAVIKLYEEQNPNVTIEAEFYDMDGYLNKLNTLVAANDVWDIFQLGGNFPTYLEKIVPIDPYVQDGTIDVSDTTEAMLQTTQYEGKQIGLSNGVNTYGIAYDPAMFAEAGVAEPADNWTWDDWKDACLTIHEKLGIYGSSKVNDFMAGASVRCAQIDFETSFFNNDLSGLGFDDYKLMEPYFQIKKELVDAGAYPDPGAISEIKDIEGDYLVTGEAAMTWVATNQLISLANAAGREIKLAVLPRVSADGPSGSVVQSSQMLCISKDSDYPEEAAKFISFFANDEEANKILNGERGVPIMGKIRDMILQTADDTTKVTYSFVDKVGTFETADEVNVLSPPQQVEIEDKYNTLMDQVIFGEITPDAAAREAYDFAKAAFE